MQTNSNTDIEKRHSDRYYLEYYFIPMLVEGVQTAELEAEAMLHIELWPEFITQHIDQEFEYDWDNLHCEGVELNEEYLLAVYIFPEPEEVPLAKYGAVLINRVTNEATYYTFEKSINGRWVLGGKSLESHYNYGSVEDMSLDKFVDWVIERADVEPVLTANSRNLPS